MVGGEGDDQLWGSGRGGIAGCYGWGWRQLWGSGRGAIGGVDVVPLQCALVGGEGGDQLWRSGRGAIAGCRCSVLWWGGGDDQLRGSGRGAFDNTKLFFAIWGLCWYNFFLPLFPILNLQKKQNTVVSNISMEGGYDGFARSGTFVPFWRFRGGYEILQVERYVVMSRKSFLFSEITEFWLEKNRKSSEEGLHYETMKTWLALNPHLVAHLLGPFREIVIHVSFAHYWAQPRHGLYPF